MNSSKDKVEETPRYKELFNQFEKIFRSNYLTLYDMFDSNVWFLREDPQFYSANSTPNEDNVNLIHSILQHSSINGIDLKKLKVSVSTFIHNLTVELIKIQTEKEKINEKINKFSIDEKKNIIEELVEKLEVNDQSNSGSSLKIAILRLANFPPGSYELKLIQSQSKKNSMTDIGIIENEIEEKKLEKKIKILNSNFEVSENVKDFTFQKIKLQPLEIKYSEFRPDEDILRIYSGTNLNSFRFEIRNSDDGTVFKTENEEILNMFIKLVDVFCDTNKSHTDAALKLYTYQEGIPSNNNMIVTANINIEMDNSVRKTILKRILYIYKITVSYRSSIENNLNSVLKYFSKYSEMIKFILEKNSAQDDTSICGKCLCF